jgi:SAM-dependent methyltransferase
MATAVDDAYGDPRIAALYDPLNPWGPGDDFYLELVMSAGSVLDLGCGTGLILRRAAASGHPGVLVGVDPAAAMLAEAARAHPAGTWQLGAAQTVDVGRRFELVIMTGHAFQVLLSDDDVRQVLANVRRHLVPSGRFAFETRNPAARGWERWADAYSTTVTDRSGRSVEVELSHVRTIEPDFVVFTGTFRFPGEEAPLTSTSTLRFIDPEHLRALVEEAGFRIDGWFGDWDRTPVTPSSPEVIVIATSQG